jgi:branched-chain amino acid transport system substrate-binding protein
MQDIKKLVVDAGKSKATKRHGGEFDWVFYQRGVVISAIMARRQGSAGALQHQGRSTPSSFAGAWKTSSSTRRKLKELGA